MPINTVEGHIGLSADEPFREGRVPFEHFLPGLEPMKFGSDIGPITFGILFGPLGNGIVYLKTMNMSMFREFCSWRKDTLLFEQ